MGGKIFDGVVRSFKKIESGNFIFSFPKKILNIKNSFFDEATVDEVIKWNLLGSLDFSHFGTFSIGTKKVFPFRK